MIPTFNCAHYLREALESILVQDPGPAAMQIEVVDDSSDRDDPAAVVKAVGSGRVGFFRQPRNVGHVRNFNTCLRRARGDLVHLLHGDDRVQEGFFSALGPAFQAQPDLGAAFCRVIVMDGSGREIFRKPLVQQERGRIRNALRVIAVDQPIQPPSMVVRRSVYEAVGGFDERFQRCGEDLEMWTRIAARFPVWYETRALACYRLQDASLSGQAIRTGQNIRETRLAIEVSRPLFPDDEAGRIRAGANQRIAFWAIALAKEMVRARDLAAARVQLLEALRSSRSPAVLAGVARVALRGLLRAGAKRPLALLARRRQPEAGGDSVGEKRPTGMDPELASGRGKPELETGGGSGDRVSRG